MAVKSGDFLPTDQELGLVAQIYSQAGCSRPGYIEGNIVAEILSSAAVDLPPFILGAIWDHAGESKSGYLSETCVAIALRLIGWAQSGEKVAAGLVNQCGPPPRVRGLIESNDVPSDWPPFTESMKNASKKLFEAYGPVYGLLEGDKARDAFTEFDLTPKEIWEIWCVCSHPEHVVFTILRIRDIADTRRRGALDKYDFALAIYLIQCVQTGQLSAIPPITPQVYEQIRSASDSQECHPPPSPQILSTPVRPRKPTRPPPPPINTFNVLPEISPRSAPSVSNPDKWSVSPSTKANAEKHFDELDTLKVGCLEGDAVARFMRGFELMPEDLALIWDLADFNHDFRLSREEFVIAMHLIEQRINGVEELSAQISARQDPCVASRHISLEQYRFLEEENSRLAANIRDLTCQIDVLHDVRTRNEILSENKAQLLVKIQEMEQITSELLQSNETASILGQLQVQANNAELNQCVSELEQLRSQLEDVTRRLDNALGENRDLIQRLREARESAEAESCRAVIEVQNMKEKIEVLEKDKEEIHDRAETLQRAFMKAASKSKTMPEMEVLMNDITRENDSLKQRLRETESSTARLLLSNKGEAEKEKLRSTNQQLTAQIRELEQLVVRLQQSSEELELQRVLKDVTIENDQLKGSLRETELEVTRLQQSVRQVEPLKTEVEELKAEIRRLHCENLRAQARVEESPIAPPAYDDDPFH
ncbi:hypothetical protein C0992_002819 [Termitomyces sp. T32_za158]|nr:hypothetical protein C0992_002819 [Termitomyces sp. T32_za158]